MLICWLTICDVTCSLETSMPGKCGWRPAFRGGPRHLVEHRGPTWSGGKDVGRSISSKLGECCPSLVTTGPLILCWYDGKKIENRIGSEWADIWISVFFFSLAIGPKAPGWLSGSPEKLGGAAAVGSRGFPCFIETIHTDFYAVKFAPSLSGSFTTAMEHHHLSIVVFIEN